MPVKFNNFKSLFCGCLLTLPLVGTRTSCLPLSNNCQYLWKLTLEKDIPNQGKLNGACEVGGGVVCISIIYDPIIKGFIEIVTWLIPNLSPLLSRAWSQSHSGVPTTLAAGEKIICTNHNKSRKKQVNLQLFRRLSHTGRRRGEIEADDCLVKKHLPLLILFHTLFAP